MAEEEKKRLYGGSYDDEIQDTYQQIMSQPKFSYDLDGDALYQQYKDRYTQNAKLAMKDTMGQTAALTGGYGNSYGHAVGQQRYDETMRGLTDMIPQLEERAYQRWKGRGDALQDRYSMLMSMAGAERDARQQSYNNIVNLIGTTGYQPTAQDLANAGMTSEQANAMLQWWITNNPDAAYNNGQLSPEDYYKLVGRYPVGYDPNSAGTNASSGSGGGGYNYVPNGSNTNLSGIGFQADGSASQNTAQGAQPGLSGWDAVRALRERGASEEDVREFIRAENLTNSGTGGGSGVLWDPDLVARGGR